MATNYGFIYGDYDIIRSTDLIFIERASQLNREKGKKYLGVGILASELMEEGTLKSTTDRMKIVLALRGVDFVFEVTGEELENRDKMLETAEQAYQEFMKTKQSTQLEANQNPTGENKKYEYIYLPGTWDLFHAGHLENLQEALKLGDKLIVGVKSDELVKEHKNRQPFLSAEERMDVLRHMKCVDEVVQSHSRNPQIAINTIWEDYGKKVGAVCVGSDLIADFEAMKDKIDPTVDIVYTSRPKDGPSTSKDTKKLAKIGGHAGIIHKKMKASNDSAVQKQRNKVKEETIETNGEDPRY